MADSFKGLKRLRTPGAHHFATPPTPGSITQRKKANRDNHIKTFGWKTKRK